MIDEFAYPPHAQEALDFIESEKAAYERKERQAERERRQAVCPHENIESVLAATMEDFTATITWCADCGASQRLPLPRPDRRHTERDRRDRMSSDTPHRVSTEQHTVPADGGGLQPTGYWYLSCTCGEWEANNVPTDQVQQVRRLHEEE